MPFKSDAQRRACWTKYRQDIKAGKKPSWDCPEWERAEKPQKKIVNGKQRVVRTGPRGGKYVLIDGEKRYLNGNIS